MGSAAGRTTGSCLTRAGDKGVSPSRLEGPHPVLDVPDILALAITLTQGAAGAARACNTQNLLSKLCPVKSVRADGVNKRVTSQTGGPGRQRGGAGAKATHTNAVVG